MEGVVDGRTVRAGSGSLVMGEGKLPSWTQPGSQDEKRPVLSVFLTVDGVPSAMLVLADEIRPDTPAAIAGLRSAGVSRIVMVTGDDEATTRTIGSMLDIDAILADCSPAQKVDAVAAEKRRAPTMMVGDGINDAPALAAATIGVAMGVRGATASSEAAGIVVLADRLDLVADALLVARRARSIAMQSIRGRLGAFRCGDDRCSVRIHSAGHRRANWAGALASAERDIRPHA